MRLFIVGNGFDLAHGMKTRYADFRDYLCKADLEFLINFEMAYGFNPIDEGDPYTPSGYNDYVKEILWWDFESNLSNIEESRIVENIVAMDLGLEMGNINVIDTMNDFLKDEYSYIKKLDQLLIYWVNTITLPLIKQSRLIGAKPNDKYLSFNYTLLLEELYEIENYNILHIHGSLVADDIDPIIGHGNNRLIEHAKRRATDASECFNEMEESAYTAVANYYENTLKDVKSCLLLNSSFFDGLKNIDEIHIIGHSLGEVDMPYFKRIVETVTPNTKWIIYFHKASDEERFYTKLIKIGVCKQQIIIKNSSEFYK